MGRRPEDPQRLLSALLELAGIALIALWAAMWSWRWSALVVGVFAVAASVERDLRPAKRTRRREADS